MVVNKARKVIMKIVHCIYNKNKTRKEFEFLCNYTC